MGELCASLKKEDDFISIDNFNNQSFYIVDEHDFGCDATNIASENINFIRVNNFVHVGSIKKVCRKGDCKFR